MSEDEAEAKLADFREPPAAEQEQMVAADLRWLQGHLPVAKFLELLSKYAAGPKFGASFPESFREIIMTGHVGRFLAHAELAANVSYKGPCPAKCVSCTEWRAHHDAVRRPLVAARDVFDEETLTAARAARAAARHSQHLYVPDHFGRLAQEKRVDACAAWGCVFDMRTNYPNQLRDVVAMCVRERVDPTALGPVDPLIDELADTTASSRVWSELRTLYEQSGLGLWPSVGRSFDCREATDETMGLGSDSAVEYVD